MSKKIFNEKQIKTILKNLGVDFYEKEKELGRTDGINVPNNFSSGKLYIFCKYEMMDKAKALGVKYDFDVKLNYIPNTVSRETVKKLLELEIKLYGRYTTVGYEDYTYKIAVPKFIHIYLDDEDDDGNGYYKIELPYLDNDEEDWITNDKKILKMFKKKPEEKMKENIKQKFFS